LAKYYELAQDSNDKLSLLRGFLGCLTSGVRYLHDSRIRHRDIKPQNVIIKDNQVCLTDFGIAHRWETLAGATTTADSGKTAIYAAPEVIRVEPRNTAADIWSLGCIFFEIATVLSGGSIEDLKAHFRQQTDTEAYHANVDNFAAWVKGLRSSRANKSDNFSWKLAQMALHFDPEDRLTAAELFEEIAKETHRTGIHFCGPCCLDDDASTSGSEAGT
jgi:serine/threonine protein kinase